MIGFLSNHKDIEPLQRLLPQEEIMLIPHPYIEPRWSMETLRHECRDLITETCQYQKLVLNGDYSLVSLIVLERYQLGLDTGFMTMEKRNEPNAVRQPDGSIRNTNVLVPVGIRWMPRMIQT